MITTGTLVIPYHDGMRTGMSEAMVLLHDDDIAATVISVEHRTSVRVMLYCSSYVQEHAWAPAQLHVG